MTLYSYTGEQKTALTSLVREAGDIEKKYQAIYDDIVQNQFQWRFVEELCDFEISIENKRNIQERFGSKFLQIHAGTIYFFIMATDNVELYEEIWKKEMRPFVQSTTSSFCSFEFKVVLFYFPFFNIIS